MCPCHWIPFTRTFTGESNPPPKVVFLVCDDFASVTDNTI